ncbi:homeobox-DDT domain protein RLT3 [Oryza brachyantha]|uniref:homeobox-DDT domain protein RLT3 n=1 Tax=Oryza brachyantha TaxID=4533 RepID=UPI001ADA1CE5|nr:homeobox-DDT domain protein RLT3 [Oryza brachyantha]XP_040381806.1 homeobox-DDT domain protein RLT3 [Oryza brachyantha]
MAAAVAQMVANSLEAKRENTGTKKSPLQIQMLERFYSEVQYPKSEYIAEYATSVGLTYSQVRIWFKERRRKERREMESLGAHMEKQLNARSNGFRCNSSSSRFASFSQSTIDHHVDNGMSFIGEKHALRPQVLFPKDYILRKVFRKDGPPLGSEFDFLPQSAPRHLRDTTDYHFYQNRRVMKKRKIVELNTHRSSVPCEDSGRVRKHGVGKGLMTVWQAMYSHSGKIQDGSNFIDETGCLRSLRPLDDYGRIEDCDDGKLIQKKVLARKKVDKRSRPPSNRRKVQCSRVTAPKKHPPVECHLSVDESQSSELRTNQVTLVDDEELELSELQAGPNPLRCSVHRSSSGRHGCPLCKDLLARFPPPSVKMKQPFSTRPWESSPEMVKKLFQVVRFIYNRFGYMDVHPFTFDELAQAFHDKDSMLLGEVHVNLLKLLFVNTGRGSSDVFVPRSSKDCRFLSFLNFVREQEFDLNFWIKSLNSLTWVEILRQVLVASGFGSKHHMLNRDFFNKEKNQMVKYGLRPRTLKGELFALLSKKGSRGLKISELAKSPEIVDLNIPSMEVDQLIYSTLSSDITLFEKITPSAYRLRVDPRIKGKEDSGSDTEDSGSVDDDSDASSGADESEGSHETSFSEHEHRITRRKRKNGHENVNRCSEIDESYSGERWLLGLMEGEYSDLSIDEKLDCLVALMDVVSGADTVPRLEEPPRVLPSIPRAQPHVSGGKIKKSTRNICQSSDECFNTSGSMHGLDSSMYQQSGSLRSHDYVAYSGRNDSSTGVAHQPQVVLLGSDRRYNNYWLFLGPCSADDPGHHRVYFESSEDGHWEVIDSPQELLSLLASLDGRGIREAYLLASMKNRQTCLFEAMKKHCEDRSVVGPEIPSETSHSETSSGDGASPKLSSGDGASPTSDIDYASVPTDLVDNIVNPSSAISIEVGRRGDEKVLKWERSQAFDKWIWTNFYSCLTAVKCGKKSFKESLVRCESCHDLYWRDEKHCRICHSTFEVSFDLEERYAIHVATCRDPEDVYDVPNHKVLPSQLQALKAAIHAIEARMPEAAFAGLWMKSSHKLWIKRLRRTSSLAELLQVLVDFVGAMDEDWLYKSSSSVSFSSYLDDITIYFQTMPQTTSAVALWVVKLDALITPYLERADSDRALSKDSLQTRT